MTSPRYAPFRNIVDLLWLLTALLVSVFAFAETPASITLAEPEAGITWPDRVKPPQSDRSILVLASLHVHEFMRVQLIDQTFMAMVSLNLQWNDPRLAYTPDPGEARRVFVGASAQSMIDRILTPPVVFYNAVERRIPDYTLSIYPG